MCKKINKKTYNYAKIMCHSTSQQTILCAIDLFYFIFQESIREKLRRKRVIIIIRKGNKK